MTGPSEGSWGDYGNAVLARLSPKVVIPFVVALAGLLVYGAVDGFDDPAIVGLVTTFVYGLLGVASPAAAGGGETVDQAEVAGLLARKANRR
jgi:hypothetical protein